MDAYIQSKDCRDSHFMDAHIHGRLHLMLLPCGEFWHPKTHARIRTWHTSCVSMHAIIISIVSSFCWRKRLTHHCHRVLYCWTTIVKGPSQAAIACMNHQRRTDVVAVIVPRDNVTEDLHTGFDKLAVWGFRACMTMELQPPPAPLRGPAGELPLELHTHGIKC